MTAASSSQALRSAFDQSSDGCTCALTFIEGSFVGVLTESLLPRGPHRITSP